MWTETSDGRIVITELSRNVVVEVAPEELPLFEELAQEYFDDPQPPDLAAEASDDPLGFGLGETLVAVTPAAAAMVSAVLTYVLTETMETLQQESAAALKKRIKELFNTDQKESSGPPPLTAEQLEQVRKVAIKQARAFGVDASQARRMSDALIGSLALTR